MESDRFPFSKFLPFLYFVHPVDFMEDVCYNLSQKRFIPMKRISFTEREYCHDSPTHTKTAPSGIHGQALPEARRRLSGGRNVPQFHPHRVAGTDGVRPDRADLLRGLRYGVLGRRNRRGCCRTDQSAAPAVLRDFPLPEHRRQRHGQPPVRREKSGRREPLSCNGSAAGVRPVRDLYGDRLCRVKTASPVCGSAGGHD